MTKSFPASLDAAPLTPEAFRPYGEVVAVRGKGVEANLGTATRYNRQVELENLRGEKAKPNLCVYRCEPPADLPFKVKLLERHARSSQVFLPLGQPARLLVVVSLGEEKPALGSLRAFITGGSQGISYRPGVWHHPMIVLEKSADLACLVYEDGSEADCEIRELPNPVLVSLSR